MKTRILSFCAFTLLAPSLFASTIERSQDLDQKDINAVREWINTKRQVTVRELGGALSISGEVRSELQSGSETVNGVQQRGASIPDHHHHFHVFPRNAFDVECNLMLDYRTEDTWTAIKLEFDNDAGISDGTLNKLKLEKAYWGIRAVDGDTYDFLIEVGRRRMSTILDSKLEFGSFFDGAWFRWDHGIDSLGDYYIHAGVYIINERKNQFGYLGEIGFLNIANTGLYMKYSLIDWDTKNLHSTRQNRRFDFIVSQWLIGYRFLPSSLKKIVQIYLGALWNCRAKKIKITDYKRSNLGGYLGLSIGELKKKGDWAFDINYQVLQAQCVPDFDAQGVGVGNSVDKGFYTTDVRGGGKATTRETAAGNVNYRGFQVTLDYLITNQLDFQQSWQQSITLDDSIGPFRRYKQYEVEFIYGF